MIVIAICLITFIDVVKESTNKSRNNNRLEDIDIICLRDTAMLGAIPKILINVSFQKIIKCAILLNNYILYYFSYTM